MKEKERQHIEKIAQLEGENARIKETVSMMLRGLKVIEKEANED